MAIKVSLIDGMGTATTDGSTVTLDGATSSDFMHIANDVLTSAGVHDNTGTSCQVTQNSPAGMSVLVKPGVVYVLNSSYVLGGSTQKYFRVENSADFEVAIASNGAGSTRIDLICAKVDVVTTPNNTATNVGTLVRVAGNPGAGVPPTPALHTALVQVSVASGATSIVNGNITDVRENITFNNNQISQLPYSSTDGKIWYEELGRTTLTSASTVVNVEFTAKKFLYVVATFIPATTGIPIIRFNADSGTNYADRISADGGADTTVINGSFTAGLSTPAGPQTHPQHIRLEISNISGIEKMMFSNVVAGALGAGNAPSRKELVHKWANNAQINQIVLRDNLGGNMAVGSEVIVLGHD